MDDWQPMGTAPLDGSRFMLRVLPRPDEYAEYPGSMKADLLGNALTGHYPVRYQDHPWGYEDEKVLRPDPAKGFFISLPGSGSYDLSWKPMGEPLYDVEGWEALDG